ncbi:hypothetical protein pb186bvf_004370 [Paramecium bursaria]
MNLSQYNYSQDLFQRYISIYYKLKLVKNQNDISLVILQQNKQILDNLQ